MQKAGFLTTRLISVMFLFGFTDSIPEDCESIDLLRQVCLKLTAKISDIETGNIELS